jgi:DNA topoisomerase IA
MKDEILDYVEKHPECFKEQIIKHCNDLGIGSRATVWKAIFQLEEEGILDIHKERRNSKQYGIIISEKYKEDIANMKSRKMVQQKLDDIKREKLIKKEMKVHETNFRALLEVLTQKQKQKQKQQKQ